MTVSLSTPDSLNVAALPVCVPIFENGSNWRCHFLNTPAGNPPVDTSFLITFSDHPDPRRPPCCIFAQPWFPPQPDFLEHVKAPFNQVIRAIASGASSLMLCHARRPRNTVM